MSRKALFALLGCVIFAGLLQAGRAQAWRQASVTNPSGQLIYFHQDGNCAAWTLSREGSRDIPDLAALQGVLRQAFDTWSAAGCSYIRFVETGTSACGCSGFGYSPGGANSNLVAWCEDTWSSEFPQEAVAITIVSYDEADGAILDTDVAMNGTRFTFGVAQEGTCDGITDVQNTMTHEAGHMLGFNESEVDGTTMFPYTHVCDTEKRVLAADDIAGLCAVYPVASNPGVCDSPIGGLDDCPGGCSGCATLSGEPPSRSLMMGLAAALCFLLAMAARRKFFKDDRNRF